MRFLVDNALSHRLAKGLSENGHDAVHVRDYGMEDSPDPAILERAGVEERCIISADTDFGTLLARSGRTQPSFVLFRGDTIREADAQLALLVENIHSIGIPLEEGAIVVFDVGRIRIRRLPIVGT